MECVPPTCVRFVNLTPHAINVVQPNGDVLTIPPSGRIARVKTYSVPAGEVAGIPVVRVEYGDIEGLPEPQPGTVYIVSTMKKKRRRVSRHVARVGSSRREREHHWRKEVSDRLI